MLINKKKLVKAVKEEGYDSKKLLELAENLRKRINEEGNMDKYVKERLNAAFTLTYSSKEYGEKPINLLINKSFLKPLAHSIFLVCKDGYAMIK